MKTRAQNVRSALQENLPAWGVLVLESHHASDFTMQWRTHGFAKIVFFLEGSGHLDIDEEVFHFSSGDVYVIPPGKRNRIRDAPESPSALYVGCIANHVLASDPNIAESLQTLCIRGPSRASTAIATQLRKLLFVQEKSTEAVSFDMLSEVWRLLRMVHQEFDARKNENTIPETIQPSRKAATPCFELNLVRTYIENLDRSFMNASSVDQAAAECGLPRRRFTELFREVTQSSWLTYVRRLAVCHAESLLSETDLPVVSVAFESGFSDVSTFYRHFKNKTGQSPAAYRRSRKAI